MHWIITPTHDDDIDCYAIPAETEANHREALEMAQQVIESRWDGLSAGESATVTIKLVDAPMPETVDL